MLVRLLVRLSALVHVSNICALAVLENQLKLQTAQGNSHSASGNVTPNDLSSSSCGSDLDASTTLEIPDRQDLSTWGFRSYTSDIHDIDGFSTDRQLYSGDWNEFCQASDQNTIISGPHGVGSTLTNLMRADL